MCIRDRQSLDQGGKLPMVLIKFKGGQGAISGLILVGFVKESFYASGKSWKEVKSLQVNQKLLKIQPSGSIWFIH